MIPLIQKEGRKDEQKMYTNKQNYLQFSDSLYELIFAYVRFSYFAYEKKRRDECDLKIRYEV